MHRGLLQYFSTSKAVCLAYTKHMARAAYLHYHACRALARSALVQCLELHLGAFAVRVGTPSSYCTNHVAVVWPETVSRRELGQLRRMRAHSFFAYTCRRRAKRRDSKLERVFVFNLLDVDRHTDYPSKLKTKNNSNITINNNRDKKFDHQIEKQ